LDGPDGAGKSTQAKKLLEKLESLGRKVLLLREPGGTATGEAIRKIVLENKQGGEDRLAPLAETFLFQAARAQLIEEVIRPALESGTWVICDRFTLSTLVYQGYAGGIDKGLVKQLSKAATQGLVPDRYFVLWVPVNIGVTRREHRAADRMESKGDAFLRAVSNGFRHAVKQSRKEYVLVDARGSIAEIESQIWSNVEPLLK